MRFSEVLEDIKILATNISVFDFCFSKICSDSKKVCQGDIFICRRGSKDDGHNYIEKAYLCGAKTFVVEKITPYLKNNPQIRYIVVDDCAKAEVKMLNSAFGYPTRNMKLIGITGTNGKTSTAYMLKSIFDRAGYKSGLISTINTLAGEDDITRCDQTSHYNSMTTPSPYLLFSYLSDMKERNIQVVIMEASSHALAQKRLDALRFELGIFTNLTEDHLDYHRSFSEYMMAKARLFSLCNNALINTDSQYGKIIYDQITCPTFSYGNSLNCDFIFQNPTFDGINTKFILKHKGEELSLMCPIPGDFTVYNAIAAASAAKMFGIDNEIIKIALERLPQIPGRLERVDTTGTFSVYIDYAHTPDALEKTLLTLRKTCKGKLIIVFGCGGDREREKRPVMGRIATSISDYTIITSDNCRNEEPGKIISEIVCGVKPYSSYKVIENRKEAILYALSQAKEGDTILLAGKGHEDYEITADKKVHFSEREIIKAYFDSI